MANEFPNGTDIKDEELVEQNILKESCLSCAKLRDMYQHISYSSSGSGSEYFIASQPHRSKARECAIRLIQNENIGSMGIIYREFLRRCNKYSCDVTIDKTPLGSPLPFLKKEKGCISPFDNKRYKEILDDKNEEYKFDKGKKIFYIDDDYNLVEQEIKYSSEE